MIRNVLIAGALLLFPLASAAQPAFAEENHAACTGASQATGDDARANAGECSETLALKEGTREQEAMRASKDDIRGSKADED